MQLVNVVTNTQKTSTANIFTNCKKTGKKSWARKHYREQCIQCNELSAYRRMTESLQQVKRLRPSLTPR